MDFTFVAPDLRALDLAEAELLACCIWSDVRPVRGSAGLLDFRLAGKLSFLSRQDFLGGARGELLVLQGRPRLPFEKVLVFGLGRKADFSEAVFVAEVKHISSALEGLRVAHAVVELPGRPDGMIAPERAAELLVASITSEAHDSWALVEDAEGQKRLGAKLEADRRHTRRS